MTWGPAGPSGWGGSSCPKDFKGESLSVATTAALKGRPQVLRDTSTEPATLCDAFMAFIENHCSISYPAEFCDCLVNLNTNKMPQAMTTRMEIKDKLELSWLFCQFYLQFHFSSRRWVTKSIFLIIKKITVGFPFSKEDKIKPSLSVRNIKFYPHMLAI